MHLNQRDERFCGQTPAPISPLSSANAATQDFVDQQHVGDADGIYTTDEAFDIIRQEGAFLESKNGQSFDGCNPMLGLAPSFETDMDLTNCDYTWIDALPGTG